MAKSLVETMCGSQLPKAILGSIGGITKNSVLIYMMTSDEFQKAVFDSNGNLIECTYRREYHENRGPFPCIEHIVYTKNAQGFLVNQNLTDEQLNSLELSQQKINTPKMSKLYFLTSINKDIISNVNPTPYTTDWRTLAGVRTKSRH